QTLQIAPIGLASRECFREADLQLPYAGCHIKDDRPRSRAKFQKSDELGVKRKFEEIEAERTPELRIMPHRIHAAPCGVSRDGPSINGRGSEHESDEENGKRG